MQAVRKSSMEANLSARLERNGKRKLRDEEDGMDGLGVSPNQEQIWEVVKSFERGLDGTKNGSRMAEAVEQPRRPQ